MGKGRLSYRKELVDFLVTYEFPGNIRELQSIVHDFVSRTDSSRLSTSLLKNIISRNLEPSCELLEQGAGGTGFGGNSIAFSSLPTLKHAEAVLIEKALELSKYNQGNAAKMLGITRQALNNRLRRASSKNNGEPTPRGKGCGQLLKSWSTLLFRLSLTSSGTKI